MLMMIARRQENLNITPISLSKLQTRMAFWISSILLVLRYGRSWHGKTFKKQWGSKTMSKLLVHLTHGPEDPTRATLAFLVAKAAKEEGHDVTIFLVANAVYLIKDSVIESVIGVGTGSLKEHFAFMLQNQIPIYLSGLSSKARGITEADLQHKNAKFADPKTLVRLNLENDRMFTY